MSRILFTDKTRATLDGPDGWANNGCILAMRVTGDYDVDRGWKNNTGKQNRTFCQLHSYILIGALTEATVLRISLLVVFDISGRPTAVKMDLSVYPSVLRSSLPTLRIFLSFTVLDIAESERFFLGEGSFRNLLTVSTWRPNFCVMASEKLPLADSLTITAGIYHAPM